MTDFFLWYGVASLVSLALGLLIIYRDVKWENEREKTRNSFQGASGTTVLENPEKHIILPDPTKVDQG